MNNTINKIGSLRCKSCNKELIDFEDNGFCYECFTLYDSYSEIEIDSETEAIIEKL